MVRGRSPHDGRRQTLALTEAGHDALLEAREAIAQHERWLKERFSESELETLVGLLRRIHD